MTTAPPLPAPTLAQVVAYVKARLDKAECGPITLCKTDLDAVKALVAEVERREGGG